VGLRAAFLFLKGGHRHGSNRDYGARYRLPKYSATRAKAAMVAANARLAATGPASVEMTPMPITGNAFPANAQMK